MFRILLLLMCVAELGTSATDVALAKWQPLKMPYCSAGLSARERQMIDGVYLQGMTISDAGATLGVTKGWASRLHARALSMLRKEAEKRDETR